MRRAVHRGFTLLEVMVALLIMGVVVSVAYAAVQGGLDTADRLAAHRVQAEAAVTVRAMLRDALRHALPGVPRGEPVFTVVDRTTPEGRAVDSLAFLTRGVLPPYGTSGAWRVSVSVDPDGLHFVAAPEGASDALPLHADVPGITALDVRMVGRGVVSAWTTTWLDAGVAPQAVTVAMGEATGRAVPLVARLSLERVP